MKKSFIAALATYLILTASLANAENDRCAMPFLCADPFGQIYFTGLTEDQCTALKEKYGDDVNQFCHDLRNKNIILPEITSPKTTKPETKKTQKSSGA